MDIKMGVNGCVTADSYIITQSIRILIMELKFCVHIAEIF